MFELLTTKPLEKTTITELAQRTQIQRKTFYLHYRSLDDVLVAFQDELRVEVQQMMVTMQPFSVAAFIAAGIVNAYSNWLMQPEKWPLTELIDDLVRLVNPIFDRLLATTD